MQVQRATNYSSAAAGTAAGGPRIPPQGPPPTHFAAPQAPRAPGAPPPPHAQTPRRERRPERDPSPKISLVFCIALHSIPRLRFFQGRTPVATRRDAQKPPAARASAPPYVPAVTNPSAGRRRTPARWGPRDPIPLRRLPCCSLTPALPRHPRPATSPPPRAPVTPPGPSSECPAAASKPHNLRTGPR